MSCLKTTTEVRKNLGSLWYYFFDLNIYIFSFLYPAVQEAQRAVEMDQNNRNAHQQLQNAQKALKISKRRDYYKILEVPRTASVRLETYHCVGSSNKFILFF